jgi:hypothetical protein
MSIDYPEEQQATGRRRSWTSLLIIVSLTFVAGMVAMGWALTNWPAAAAFIGVKTPVEPPMEIVRVAASPPAAMPVQAAEGAPSAEETARAAEVSGRLQALEHRIAAIDTQTRQAAGDAERAESLLLAFAARRALDRGVGLGYLENLLRERFGGTQPQAVATIISASNQPVTLQALQDELQRLEPELVKGGPDQGWWTALRRELSDLVAIRRSDSPITLPADRMERAKQRLEAGQVTIALAEVNRLPGRDKAGSWFAEARRYLAARDALDRLETAALLEPRAGGAPLP